MAIMEHASAPLMALGEARSDGKMGSGTNGKPSTKTGVDNDNEFDVVDLQIMRPACVGMALLVLCILSFVGGYYIREHQSKAEQAKFSLMEDAFLNLTIDNLLDTHGHQTCPDGLLISGPIPHLGNAFLFLILLLWSFLGVAVLADMFMVAIEHITSQETVFKITLPSGKKTHVTSLIWNPTISNLSLMALGSSAPEILLSVIEISTSGFYAGELGPSTIVGSAAFNMLVISAVCVMAIPPGEGRLIKELPVFYITATFSIFAYLWLLLILVVISPNIVEVWEGLVTFALFPFLVWLAYRADQGTLPCVTTGRLGDGQKNEHLMGAPRDLEAEGNARWSAVGQKNAMLSLTAGVDVGDIAVQLTQSHSGSHPLNSRAFYRVNATRGVLKPSTTQSDILQRKSERNTHIQLKEEVEAEFNVESSTLMLQPDASEALLVLLRSGNVKAPVAVSVRVKGASGSDEMQTVSFGYLEQAKTLAIPVKQGDKKGGGVAVLEVELLDPTGLSHMGPRNKCKAYVAESEGPGTLLLAEDVIEVDEEARKAVLLVKRINGYKGRVACKVNTKDNTAVSPSDYMAIENMSLVFEDREVEKTVEVTIINDGQFEGDEEFSVVLSELSGGAVFSQDCDGGPERAIATVTIKGDAQKTSGGGGGWRALLISCGYNEDQMKLVYATWSSQFEDAFAFEEELDARSATIYLLSMPWKLACAFAPPTRLANGWACFFVVLALIGVLTAFIGDLAGHMGCCMGMAPSVTAITFVALGTSLPDTFASMSAAANEEHADASIGNITGSNSVNVFLGLGLPWAVAAIYWSFFAAVETESAWHARYGGEPWYSPGMPVGFAVPAGELGFSVGVFSACALVCLMTLILRRAVLGFELGHSLTVPTAALFVGLWFVYIAACVWNSSQSA